MEEIQSRQNALQKFIAKTKRGLFATMLLIVKEKHTGNFWG